MTLILNDFFYIKFFNTTEPLTLYMIFKLNLKREFRNTENIKKLRELRRELPAHFTKYKT